MKYIFLSHLDYNLLKFRLPIMSKLVELGNRVYAVCPRGEYSSLFLDKGIKHIQWNCVRENRVLINECSYIYELIKIFNHIKPVIVHAFTIRPNLYSAYALMLRGEKIKLINSVTGLGSLYISGSHLKIIYKQFVNIAYKIAFLRSQHVIFQNSDDSEFFIRKKIVSEKKISLIRGSGVDLKKFTPALSSEDKKKVKLSLGFDKSEINILLVGRIIKEKGILEYLSAAKILKQKYNKKINFSLIGWLDDGNPSCISNNVLQNFNSYINFWGRIDNLQMYFKACDIYCLPSYREGLPVTVIEAMASGLPIVTTYTAGCRETVDEGINGYTVPVGNIDMLVDRLEKLINDHNLRISMGEASRKKAEREFSIDNIINQHISLYDRIITEKLSS